MVTICLQLVDIKGDIGRLVAFSSVHDMGDSKALGIVMLMAVMGLMIMIIHIRYVPLYLP